MLPHLAARGVNRIGRQHFRYHNFRTGPGSLRAVLATAVNGDTIAFSLPVPATITLRNGELLITNDVIISGAGATNLAISGNSNSRVFNIATNRFVSFSGLTIRDGHASSSSDGPSEHRQGPRRRRDGGGRPYFVTELVRGIRITDFCDQKALPTRERLKLFMKVCQAVQHAHQKGIIHRDLKPSNVLVTLHDGEPVPKVIDFGVAKALGQKLTEKTFFTAFAQMIGTPAYMSPEQAELSGLD